MEQILSLLPVFLPVITTFVGIWIGNALTKNNNEELERRFMKKRLRAEKIEVLLNEYSNISRSISKINLLTKRLVRQEISSLEFRNLEDEQEIIIADSVRLIAVNMPVISEFEESYDAFLGEYIKVMEKVHQKYINKENEGKMLIKFSPEQISDVKIKDDFELLLKLLETTQKKVKRIIKRCVG